MPKPTSTFERAIEKSTGESIESLRSMTISDRRMMIEKRYQRPLVFTNGKSVCNTKKLNIIEKVKVLLGITKFYKG